MNSDYISDKNKKKFLKLGKKWDKVYTKFLADVDKLKEDAGKDILDIQMYDKDIRCIFLYLNDI